ncbi:MAG: L-histidine N(alpha)-methyltransferase [Halioglobus sp.]|nr:L-histidine N(alpha)-methyltransferase [Halioglobus sp.]
MPVTAARVDNVFFEDQQPESGDSRAEVIAGLEQPQKRANPKYFYDERGSGLFEQITRQPEYYPTRTEMAILRRHAGDIARLCGRGCVLIEPGSGSSEKVRLLLSSVRPAAYIPLDISAAFLYQSALKLGREFPWLQVHAICADFADRWYTQTDLPAGRRIIFYPGSTIGNMEPAVAREFLAEQRGWIGADGAVLIGVDLDKPEDVLNAAYNDAGGVTAEFNLNILNTINRVAGADFDTRQFSHRAVYNKPLQRIEMHLVSEISQTVQVDGGAVTFASGETLHTENSYKYTLEDFKALVEAAGYTLQKSWLDDRRLFSVHFLSVRDS